jgi:hypothetical protein
VLEEGDGKQATSPPAPPPTAPDSGSAAAE